MEQLMPPSTSSKLDDILRWAQVLRGGAKFEDDMSILELLFQLESGTSQAGMDGTGDRVLGD